MVYGVVGGAAVLDGGGVSNAGVSTDLSKDGAEVAAVEVGSLDVFAAFGVEVVGGELL